MSWILQFTNRDEAYWVARVQQLIAKNTVTEEGAQHGSTDLKWIKELADEVENLLPPGDPPYDGNLRMAAELSAILGLWFAQCSYAKSQDPNRPTHLRQNAYSRLFNWAEDFILNIFDHSAGATYFPGQKWSDPWNPDDRGGQFV